MARTMIRADKPITIRADEPITPAVLTGDAPPGAGPVGASADPPGGPIPSPPAGQAPPSPQAPAPAAGAGPASADPGPGPAPAPGPAPVAGGLALADIARLVEAARDPAQRIRITREPSPYIEGGLVRQDRGFFCDLYAARARGDGEAGQRAAQFQSQLRDYLTAAATDTAAAGEIIPPAWGGQWYVPEIQRMRPVISAFASAPITDPRPIPIPTFAGTVPPQIVATHAEGVPDVAGQVKAGKVTMTPAAKSGRAEVSRELIDSSPALVDLLVSSALRESYAQVTELDFATLVTAGATPGPPGGADAAALEGAVRTALAMFPGTRFLVGGAVMPSANMYAVLVTANGTDGRPLFPYLGYGPTNASGTMGAGLGDGQVAGVPMAPAWAVASDTVLLRAGAQDAMHFESSLLEFRFQEKSGPELVEFNVWGYAGGVVRQPLGIIKVTSAAIGPMADGGGGGGGGTARKGEK